MQICIIGNGISGITAARHIRKLSNHPITVISAESDYFYSRTALMYIYMGHMRYEHTKPYEDWFWEKNNIDLIRDFVEYVDSDNKTLHFQSGRDMHYDKLILATGSKPNKIGWPGENLIGVQGLYGLYDLQRMEENTKNIDRAVIVGGGLIGIEMTEMLQSRDIPVTMLVREKDFWDIILPAEEANMISRHIIDHHVDLRRETELKEIKSDENGRARAVVTKGEEEIPCQFVGLTIGVSPNIAFLKDSKTNKVETDKGILVNEYFETNLPDVYAIGDCAQFRVPFEGRPPIEQIWYTGRIHGEVVARTILGKRTAYKPGVFFNSAKFLDIEYQVYGKVSNIIKENEEHFYWEHPSENKSLRIVYDKNTEQVKGINLLGIRFRHAVCEQWIKNQATIQQVMKNLRKANFDGEFAENYNPEIREAYNKHNPAKPVEVHQRKKVLGLF